MELTESPGSQWSEEGTPKDWRESISVTIYKKDDEFSCENHRGNSLVSFPSKLPVGIIPCLLTTIRERLSR